ncbi:hypothetical protein HW114_05615 [Serratia symbiotica]|uniref:hypothetical protein n=1 Tax=Serratia symbiotica TaxID=138074 RepID=UPI001369FE77|nr:hypothetical protein [Serratia symbiotica]MBF1995031.1 hypothetical protein [Serratia symbiotica]QTP15383.1 hypothetical protein GPZ83_0005525 [Serratia symbiotica]
MKKNKAVFGFPWSRADFNPCNSPVLHSAWFGIGFSLGELSGFPVLSSARMHHQFGCYHESIDANVFNRFVV